jgi:hypothetical protein
MSVDTLTPDGALVTLPPPPNPFFPFTPDYAAYKQIGLAVAGGSPDELIGLAIDNSGGVHTVGYSIDGTMLFSSSVSMPFPVGGDINDTGPVMGATDNGNGAVFTVTRNAEGHFFQQLNGYALVVNADGSNDGPFLIEPGSVLRVQPFATPSGFALEWIDDFDSIAATGGAPVFTGNLAYYAQNGVPSGPAGLSWSGNLYFPFAETSVGGKAFTVFDNQATLAGSAAATLPGEPVHATTDLAAVGLAGGSSAAVAWVDSGTDYVSIFNASTDSFGPRIGLDWGGASDLHLVALPGGGFVVSWQNGGAYKGEVFDAAGNGGGLLALPGQVMAIDSHGDLYTVGQGAEGEQVVQTYAINGGSTGGGSTVSTSDPNYTAPAGVTTIFLTGANQMVHANNGGDVIFSNDTGNALYGGTGNDTFHLGRGGDWAAGGGGGDTFVFAGIPWAAGGITDFGSGDVLDLGPLLTTTQDIPAGGFSDGYLQLTDDGAGDTDVWARYATSGANSNWWLVTVLDGITTASLDAHHTVVTLAPNAGQVSTSAADYVAPAYVHTILLTGSHQTIDATAASGVTIVSNDSGNVLLGGAGDDIFHIGRGGDWIAGGAGADTFAYAGTPWAGGGITDFNAAQGDRVDVSGLLHASGYAGSDPFADGYLMLTSDSGGNAQLWSDVHQPGNDGWWLVATLDGVSTSSLHYSGGLLT